MIATRWIPLTACGMLLIAGVGSAQEGPGVLITLRGMVADSTLRPVSGALVYLSSAGTFSVSDDEGEFLLADVEHGVDTLEFRGMGFAPRTFRLVLPDSVRDTVDLGIVQLAPGPLPRLALTVAVRDTARDQPVVQAQVMVNDRVVGVTDTAGMLSAIQIPIDWGMNAVLVRRVGYSPLFRTFWVGAVDAQRAFTGFMVQQAVDLPAVVVEADRIILTWGRMREFWHRRERGLGRFITRAEIERRHPVYISDMLRMVPGLSVSRNRGTTEIRSTRSAGRCAPGIWVDGQRLTDVDLDAFVHPQDVEAIEVYRGVGETPVEFSSGFSPCGAIVVWTR